MTMSSNSDLPEGDSLVGSIPTESKHLKKHSLMSRDQVDRMVTQSDTRITDRLNAGLAASVNRDSELNAQFVALQQQFTDLGAQMEQSEHRARDAAAAVIQLGLALQDFIVEHERRTWRGRWDAFLMSIGVRLARPKKDQHTKDCDPQNCDISVAEMATVIDPDPTQMELEILPDIIRHQQDGGE